MLETCSSKNIEIDHVDNDITFLVETPRGRTAVAAVPPSVPYESFVGCLWEAAAARDLEHFSTKCGSNNNSSHNNKRQVGFSDEATTTDRRDRSVRRCTRSTFIVHNGKVLGREEYNRLMQSSAKRIASHRNNGSDSLQQHQQQHSVSLRLRLRGGVDRQNRVGSKFGGGGVSSAQNADRERKERLKQLALESIDLAKDPYLMRNHLGTYECKLCLTLHTNEANYLAHTQGKKHQAGLAKRAAMEKARAEQASANAMPMPNLAGSKRTRERKVRIGRPAYQIYKNRDVDTNQRCLSFELQYPEIDKDVQPRHRFMSSYEQRVEPPDRRYQYLLVAADPYETVAFKIPNEPIDKGEGRFVTHWDEEVKKFTLTLYFMEPTDEKSQGTGLAQ